jgi:hypothetical protein
MAVTARAKANVRHNMRIEGLLTGSGRMRRGYFIPR